MSRRVSDTATREPSGTAGTDAERRAALALADDLRAAGRDAARADALGAHRVVGAAGARRRARRRRERARASATRSPGSSLAAVALWSSRSPTSPRRADPPADARARATQNVVSAPADGPAGRHHADRHGGRRTAPRSGRSRRFPGGVLRWSLGGARARPGLLRRRAPRASRTTWVGAVQLPPTLVLLACLLALLDEAVADPVEDGPRRRGAPRSR